ncbi:hypothetical protein CQW23_23842 [Capsicum baccatum]|uniref:Ubiquitin-like protease family profile domain-containing protein n=1 Tax=Capsicum baccatum TaxID=33114 RepID=A0A2G2VT58_CAPBA|nr:hypothetical protein CQW23_23842 [Capsicum baccatum]
MGDNYLLQGNPFDVEYVEGVSQQSSGSLDCSLYVATYAEYLSDGLQVPNDKINVELLRKRYATLLGNYEDVKAEKRHVSDDEDSQQPKLNFIAPNE